jgi:hypothetical protein
MALTLMDVSPPWACCSRKTWATMCSVEGCSRILREAKPTITYRPIGDKLTEMALGPEDQNNRDNSQSFFHSKETTFTPSFLSYFHICLIILGLSHRILVSIKMRRSIYIYVYIYIYIKYTHSCIYKIHILTYTWYSV